LNGKLCGSYPKSSQHLSKINFYSINIIKIYEKYLEGTYRANPAQSWGIESAKKTTYPELTGETFIESLTNIITLLRKRL
jgi:hypothetical protein